MRKAFVVYTVLLTIGFLCLGVYVVRAQTGEPGQARVPVDNRGLKAQVEALENLVATLQDQVQTQEGFITVLQAKQVVVVTGQVFDYRLAHEQTGARILEAGLLPETRMIWVCDPNEPTGEKQITRDQYIINAGIVNAQRAAQVAALLAGN